jgi:2-methylisocitrate lyase-like PEP mutase family enzyme
MNQELRDRFGKLHQPGKPVLLYNIWDVASAKAVAAAGAPALATGSYAISEANGYKDGEAIPFNL